MADSSTRLQTGTDVNYDVYKSLHLHLSRIYRHGIGESKKAVRGRDMEGEALRMLFSDDRAGLTMEAAILSEEEDYENEGRRVFFPEDEFLLRALWRARMEIDVSHLEAFPRCVTVSWPSSALIEGVALPACLVWCGSRREHHELMMKTIGKYVPVSSVKFFGNEIGGHDDKGIHITWAQKERDGMRCCRSSIPFSWVSSCLKSENDLVSKLPSFDALMTVPLTVAENHVQYVLAKMLVHLFVYVQACPNAVVSGWPDRVGMRDFEHQWRKDAMPFVVGSPKGASRSEVMGLGSHGSPEPHWRTWHFRSFPAKRDGTKRLGTVFVRGTMVGGDIEPATVIEVGMG